MGRTIIFQLLACTFFSAVCSNPIVDLGYAQYQGVFDPNLNVTNYRGVRYAAAPTGDLRWREPKPPGNVSEVQQANTDPPSCYQSQGGGGALGVAPGEVEAESEDCLFLNVAVPGSRIPSDGDLPVVVWIPGGGYIYGNASQFQASDLVKDSQNSVVSVVMQYRLGLFGFLAGNEVKENGALNIGLLDQQFALRWVREHISKFGGDPTKVTIWGESSGGGSVLEHIVAEDGQTNPGLFRSGISVSTFLYSHYEYNDEIPEGMYNEVLSQTNCSSSPDHFSCLRAVDAKVLATINNNINTAKFFLTSAFLPVIDGTFLTQRVTQALKQGKLNGEVLLAVALTNEGVRFVNQSASLNASRVARELFPKFGSKEAAAVAKQYEGLGTEVEQATLVLGESTFVCPTYFLTEAFGDRAFKGQFAIPPSLHTDDLRYYFPNSAIYGLPPSSYFNNTDFQKAFYQSFLSFVISQDPNVKLDPSSILPKWNRFGDGKTHSFVIYQDPNAKPELSDGKTHSEMVFNKTDDTNAPDIHSVVPDQALLERCRFWESVAALTSQ